MITVEDIRKAKDLVQIGDYVLASRPVSSGNHRDIFMVSRVVLKSKYVFVTEVLGTAFPGVRTSYRYADLLAPDGVSVVPEEEALYAAETFKQDRMSFSMTA